MAFTTVPLTTSYDISSQGELSIGGCELGGFKSATLTIEGESVDNYARGDGGWSTAAPGKRSWSLDLTFLRLKSDACQVGLRALATGADYQSKGVAVAYSDGATSGGFSGTAVLSNYSEKQADGGEAVECTVNLKGYGALTINPATRS